MAVAPVSLMVFAPFVWVLLGCPMLWFHSWSVSPLVCGSPKWPLLMFRSLCSPPFTQGPLGQPSLQFFPWCICLLWCMAHWDGRCSSFTHGVSPFVWGLLWWMSLRFRSWCVRTFMHGSTGWQLLWSYSCLLLPLLYYAEVAWVTDALVSPMGVCVATSCCACLSAHYCLAHSGLIVLLMARLISVLRYSLCYSLLCSLLCLPADWAAHWLNALLCWLLPCSLLCSPVHCIAHMLVMILVAWHMRFVSTRHLDIVHLVCSLLKSLLHLCSACLVVVLLICFLHCQWFWFCPWFGLGLWCIVAAFAPGGP